MPIAYRIDPARRLVLAQGVGALTDEDVFQYQREVWSRPDVAGYDELIDVSKVERIDLPSVHRVIDLARLSAGMDAGGPSRLAIVAPADRAFGLGRMYQAYRGLEESSQKQVGVFRTLEEAFAFLAARREPPNQGAE